MNVPFILAALIAGSLLVPSSEDPSEQPLDVPGALLSIVGLGALVYAIIEAPHLGWLSTETLLTFGLALVAIVAFGARERTARHPMLDLSLVRDRRFSVASAGIRLTCFAMFGTFFIMAQYLQLVLGDTPFQSGLFPLPFAFIMMSVAPRVPRLVARWGAAKVVPTGLLSTATGLAAFSSIGVDSSLLHVYACVLPLGLGMAVTVTPLTTLIMSSVPLGRAGVGSAMNDTTRELGGALGVAVLGSVVTSQYTSGIGASLTGLSEQARALADSGLAGALRVAGDVGGVQGEAVALAAKQAFVDGLSLAAIVGSVVVFVAAFVSWKLLPRTASAPFVSPARDDASVAGKPSLVD